MPNLPKNNRATKRANRHSKSVSSLIWLKQSMLPNRLQINKVIEDGKNYGYVLDATRYFFVDKFYRYDFKKISPQAPMGSRVFDLTKILEKKRLPETTEIAELLYFKTWSQPLGRST